MNKIRLVIADDHEVVRKGLMLVLSQEADFEILAEAHDGREAVALAARHQPDLILLDWKMPELDEGVDGFAHKDTSPADLAKAIRIVAGGRSYLGPEIKQALARRAQATRAPHVTLTPREMEVLRLMATAATYREIGEQLHISEETVRSHAKNILAKLDQPNRTQSVIAAVRAGLIDLE